MSQGSRASFASGNVVLTDSGEKYDGVVVWHGGMKSPYGGHTKGELLEPRDSFTHPMWTAPLEQSAPSLSEFYGQRTNRKGFVGNQVGRKGAAA